MIYVNEVYERKFMTLYCAIDPIQDLSIVHSTALTHSSRESFIRPRDRGLAERVLSLDAIFICS